jgi:4-aminobutyrate aminotransferase-like enzyme
LLVHDKIVEVRGKDLIIDWFLFRENSIRLAPPLVIKKKEIRQACKILLEVIEEIENKL